MSHINPKLLVNVLIAKSMDTRNPTLVIHLVACAAEIIIRLQHVQNHVILHPDVPCAFENIQQTTEAARSTRTYKIVRNHIKILSNLIILEIRN